MKAYLCWSLHQLYLLAFWPTRFAREVEGREPGQPRLRFGERLRYLGKMLPWMIAFVVLGNLVTGQVYDTFWDVYRWGLSWSGAALGMAVGVAAGVAAGVMAGVTFVLVYFRLLTYPFDVALTSLTYVVSRWRPRTALPQAWRWCPVAWNEVI